MEIDFTKYFSNVSIFFHSVFCELLQTTQGTDDVAHFSRLSGYIKKSLYQK